MDCDIDPHIRNPADPSVYVDKSSDVPHFVEASVLLSPSRIQTLTLIAVAYRISAKAFKLHPDQVGHGPHDLTPYLASYMIAIMLTQSRD